MTDLQKILELIEAKKKAEKADGCSGCAFESVEEWEMPCCKCKRGCKDYYRPEESE